MRRIFRKLRGALGNAIVWGTSWFAGTWALFATSILAGAIVGPEPWRLAFMVAANVGLTGFLTGGVFSAYLSFVYEDHPLLDLKANRVALGGAAVASLFFVAFGLALAASRGDPLFLGDFVAGAFWTGVLGATMAGGTIKIAQRSARQLTETAASELTEEQNEVAALLEGEAT